MIKLNLGCGLQCPKGWINIDSSIGVKLSKRPLLKKIIYSIVPASVGLPNADWPENTMWMDLTKPFNFKNESVDIVYSSHTFEHLTYEETTFVLKECYRILKPGGLIRVIVPDFQIFIDDYLENKAKDPSLAAFKFHQTSGYFEIPVPNTFKGLLKFYFKRKNNHAFLYDKAGLHYQFDKAGFKNLDFMMYGKSKINDIQEIDIESRFKGAICIEGKK